MSDLDPQTRDLRSALNPTDPNARRETRNIPPLVWIVLVVLIALAAYAYFGRSRTDVTPSGGTVPAVSSSTATTPAPASSGG